MRLDHFLREKLFWRSRASVQRLIGGGAVLLAGGRRARPATRVREGEILTVLLPARPPLPLPVYPSTELPVLYRDRVLLAVDKPAGLPVHPSGRHQEGTLVGLLHRHFWEEGQPPGRVPRLCHRLDRETSGVILATTDESVRHLVGRQFEERSIVKTYLALVEGCPDPPAGIIDLPLAPDPRSRVRMAMEARRDGRGRPALTRYRVTGRGERFSLVQVVPATGRQHQIRVHLAAIGHPLVGDKIYGPDAGWFLDSLRGQLSAEAKARLVLERHALHAWKLEFSHPLGKERMEVVAPLPEDMADLL